ncbi:S26 family signal peptidase [Streptomyces sp. NPDC059479]|uniref:S26 family signal peptidase n=1 Tax=Streptomyces sp. NPDC059479 TaxID=3346848 RepID=UPI00368F4887
MRALIVTAAALAALTPVMALVVRRRCVLLDVSGPSMLPTYRDGDRLLAARLPIRLVRRGTVVAIGMQPASDLFAANDITPGRPLPTCMVKRVAALPGEQMPDPLLATAEVPPRHLFVLGDNREASYDSRHMGPVPFARLSGVVLCRIRSRGSAHVSTPGSSSESSF